MSLAPQVGQAADEGLALGAVRGLVAGTVAQSAVDGPGNRYVVFLQGCGWDCLACHNPATIPLHPQRAAARSVADSSVADVIGPIAAVSAFLTGVTVTGGEPTQQPEFLAALLAGLARHPLTARLTRFVDTNGDAPLELWDRLAPVLDGAMVDLKSIDPERHLVLTGHGNQRALASIARLAALGRLYEVRLLLVPGINDDDALLRRTAHWLLSLDPAIRVRVNGFRRQGTRACARELLEVTAADRERYTAVLSAEGVTSLLVS